MKKTKRFFAALLAAAITVSLAVAIPLTASAASSACSIGRDRYSSFGNALKSVKNGQTITLLNDINYDGRINARVLSFTIDLNGYSLTVNGSNDYGVYVYGRTLTIAGSGSLTITGVKAGIYADIKGIFSLTGSAKVNVTGTEGPGIIADGGATVFASGARGKDDVKIIISGDVAGSSFRRKITLASPYDAYYWDEYSRGSSRVYLRGDSITAASNNNPDSPSSGEWLKKDGKWYFYREGSAQTGWILYDDSWYFMDSNGQMQTGWVKHKGSWYYLSSSGAMVTGWLRQGNKTYYLLPDSGAMATGWLLESGKWYFLLSDGNMLANATMVTGGRSYQFDSQGVCENFR